MKYTDQKIKEAYYSKPFFFLSSRMIMILFSFLIMICGGFAINNMKLKDDEKNILLGVVSSAFLIILIEYPFLIIQGRKYKYLNRPFKRVEQYNYNYTTETYDPIDITKTNNAFFFKPLGDGRYKGLVSYHDDKKVEFDIAIDTNNPNTGLGTYQYLDSIDFGTYTLMRSKNNKNKIILIHENISPSNKTKGFEILEAIS